jgi:hypothetical protein
MSSTLPKTVKVTNKTCNQFRIWLEITAGILIGLPLGIYILILLTGVFPVICPEDCNGNGICLPTGYCQCTNPLYSGESCSDTLMYVDTLGNPCAGNGKGNTKMLDEYKYPECREITPDSSNDFTRSGGWLTTACKQKVDMMYAKLHNKTITAIELLGLPFCECNPGFIGDKCIESGCLVNSQNELICSGQGNTSVGLMRNNTNTGTGCMCITPQFPLQFFNEFSIQEQAHIINNNYYNFLAQGQCGTLIQDPSNFDATFVLYPEYMCSCALLFEGPICEETICPQVEGVPCNGQGHPEYGFGVAKNTTNPVQILGSKGCFPICSEGNVLCPDGRCVSKLSLCTRPTSCENLGGIRCPDGRCTSLIQGGCDLQYETGAVDNLNSVRVIREPVYNGQITINSPLVVIMFRLLSGVMTVSYYKETVTFSEIGLNSFTFAQDYDTDSLRSFTEIPGNVTVYLNTTWRIQPVPWFYSASNPTYPTMRIYNQLRYAVIDVEGSYVYENATSTYGIAYVSNTTVLRPYGSIVSLDVCYTELKECVWSTSTFKSEDGQRILCLVNGVLASSFDFSCTTPPESALTGISTGAMFLSRLSNIDLTGQDWSLQLAGSRSSVITFTSNAGTEITDLQLVQVDDLIVPCACAIASQTQADLNQIWLEQMYRLQPSAVGQHFVGQYSENGNSLTLRATVTNIINGAVFGEAKGLNAPGYFTRTKYLNKTEFIQGVEIADKDVFPSICPNGEASRVSTIRVNATTSCNCLAKELGKTSCTCTSSLAEPFLCSYTVDPFTATCATGVDSDIVTEKFVEEMTRVLNTQCFLTRITGESDPQEAVFVGNDTWSIRFGNVSYPGWLDLVFLNGTCDLSAKLYGKASIFQSVFEPLNITTVCNEYNDTVITPIYNAAYVYDEFELVSETTNWVEVLWSPTGIPMNRLWSMQYIGVVEPVEFPYVTGRNAFGTWVGVDFYVPRIISALYVNFQTVGINGFEIAVTTEVSNDTRVWTTIAMYATNVENGIDGHLYQFAEQYARYIRVFSLSPMVINSFVPLADQYCPVGLLIPQASYEPYVLYTENYLNNLYQFLDINATSCVSIDECLIANVSMVNNGICDDELGVGWGLPWITTKSIVSVTPPENITLTCFNSTDYDFFTNGSIGVWYVQGTSFPVNYTTWENIQTLTSIEDNQYCYMYNSDLYDITEQGQVIEYTINSGFEGLAPGSFCANGTDVTDCGASARTIRTAPGLLCNLTVEQSSMLADIENRTDYFTTESRTIEQFLSGPTPVWFEFAFTFSRDLLRLTRVDCGDCDGLLRCKNGDCVVNEADCPETIYNCEGNGCVRYDVNIAKYTCACREGVGGFRCSVTECARCDPLTGLVPIEQCCSVGLPPLRSKPPGSLIQPRTRPTLESTFLLNDPTGSGIVYDRNVRPEFAPYGIIREYWFQYGNVSYSTQCPPAARDPVGRPALLEDCVKTRDAQGNPTSWVDFPTPDGGTVQIIWNTPYQYNDFPYRCPVNGWCVSDPNICDLYDQIRPPCNNHGKLMVDGTCKCDYGWKTFILTEEFTRSKRVPYLTNEAGVTNPTAWGIQNRNSYFWSYQYCAVRNCEEVDCSPPVGCFVGTEKQGYKDALVECPNTGMCAIDIPACERGELVPKLICSGNGLPRKRDYRENEWYCQCGTPKSTITEEITESTQLESNGWGGVNCGLYFCSDPNVIWWSPYNEVDNDYWRTPLNEALPGKWIGPCGAVVGPDPDEHELTKVCCEGYERLELCPLVRCQINGYNGDVICIPAGECIGPNRIPLVYVGNNKGIALADGSLKCNFDSLTGVGYTSDPLDFPSQKSCYRMFTCPVSSQRNTPCNRITPGEDWNTCLMPKIPYFENQWATYAAREGKAPTNRTLVLQLIQDINSLNALKEQAYTAKALEVIAAQQQLGACVCVYPGNDNTCCMNPGSSFTYSQPYKAAYEIPVTNKTDVLTNNEWSTSEDAVENVDYVTVDVYNGDVTFINTYNPVFGGVRINFTTNYSVSAIRVFGQNKLVQGISLAFYGSDGNKICGDQVFTSLTVPSWLGPNRAFYCVSTFIPYDFERFNRQGWLQFCQTSEISEACVDWKVTACPSTAEVRLPSSLDFFIGCMGPGEVCCVPLIASFPLTSYVQVVAFSTGGNVPLGSNITLGEIEPYGYIPNQIVPMPPILSSLIQAGTGADNVYFKSKLPKGYVDGTYYVFATSKGFIPNVRYADSPDSCLSSGGVFAASTSNDIQSILQMGNACANKNSIFSAVNDVSNCIANDCAPNRIPTSNAPDIPKCLVSAKNRNTVKDVLIDQVIYPVCSANGCWISTDSGLDPAVPPSNTRLSQWDVYSAPNEGLFYRTRWVNSLVPWSSYLTKSYLLSQKQVLAQPLFYSDSFNTKTPNHMQYYPYYEVDFLTDTFYSASVFNLNDPTRPTRGWDPFNPNRAANLLLKTSETFVPPTSQCNSAPYCNIQTRVDAGVGQRQVDVGVGAVTEYFLVDKTCKITFYSRPSAGRCNGVCGTHMSSQFTMYSDAAYYSVILKPSDFLRPVRIMGILDSQTTYTYCVDGSFDRCRDWGIPVYGNIDSIAVEGDCTLYTRTAFLDRSGNPLTIPFTGSNFNVRDGFLYQQFTGPSTQEQGLGVVPTFEGWRFYPWWVNQYPYGLYPNCINGFTNIAFCQSTETNSNVFFGGNSFQWMPGGYPIIDQNTAGNPQGINDLEENLKFQAINVFIQANFPIVKIRTTVRARQFSDGSSEGLQPNFNMGWSDHPYMCSNVKVEWIPMYGRINQAQVNNLNNYVIKGQLNFYNDVEYNQPIVTYEEGEPIQLNDINTPYVLTEDRLFTISDFDIIECETPQYLDVLTKRCETPNFPTGKSNRFFRFPKTPWLVQLKTGRVGPLTPCASLGNEVKRCVDCVIPRRLDMQWGATFYDASNIQFPVQTDLLTTQFSSIYVLDAYRRFHDFASEFIQYYANRIAVWRTPDYLKEFWFDDCLYVSETLNSVYQYGFYPYPCPNRVFPALCMLDTVRYVSVDGTTCDVFGPSSRPGGFARPNTTCLDLYPEANPELNPSGFIILEAYRNGQLSTLINNNNYDYDAIAAFIQNDTQSVIAAWKEFDINLLDQFSDRVNHLSIGAFPNTISWVDAGIFKHFPYDCGPVTDPDTGITRNLWAFSEAHCTYGDTVSKTPLTDYPTILDPLQAFIDPTTQPICGVVVELVSYRTWNGFGAASTLSTMIFIGQTITGAVELEAPNLPPNVTVATWINTGKNEAGFIFTANLSTTLTGSLTCQACTMTMFLTPLNPTYSNPTTVIFVGNQTGTGNYRFNFTAPNDGQVYQIVGLNFSDTVPTEIVTVSNIIITTEETIAICRRGYPDRFSWIEAPLAMVSCNQDNICISNSDLQQQYNYKPIGTCFCQGTAWGGDTCECPALDTRAGTRVCGGSGVTPGSLMTSPIGTTVTVSENGCYKYGETFACACKDVGSILRTRRFIKPSTVYELAIINDLIPNQALYVLAPAVVNILFVLTKQLAEQVCGAVSTVLPSWPTADLAQAYLQTVTNLPLYSDLVLRDDLVLFWDTLDIEFSFNPPIVSDIPVSEYFLNWNNLVFVASSSNVLINGLYNASTNIVSPTDLTLTRSSVLQRGVTVAIYTSTIGSKSRITTCAVTATCGGAPCSGACTVTSNQEYACTDSSTSYNVTKITVNAGSGCSAVTEIGVFDGVGTTSDRGRNPYFI